MIISLIINFLQNQVEVLSAIASYIAKRVGAQTVVDVGAGQVCRFFSRDVFLFLESLY